MTERERLPAERPGITHAFTIFSPPPERGGHGTVKGYVTVNYYEDGRIGEVFLKLDAQGSAISGLCDAWSIAVSMLLQSGTPAEKIVEKFRGARFQPAGQVKGVEPIHFCVGPLDYVARYLAHLLKKTEEPKQLAAPVEPKEKPE